MPDDVVEMALMINGTFHRDDPSEIILSCSRKPEVRARDSNHSIGSSSHPRLHLMPGLPSTPQFWARFTEGADGISGPDGVTPDGSLQWGKGRHSLYFRTSVRQVMRPSARR